ncbi:hypothetical protein O7602_26635 [Micromonospora sp. WMMD1128]|uniref:hypothetical protein n=1 Tax=Micromonospora sp. WMMD1128 TaxID=3015150 RepID=UPI00248D2211|nr:hypothetical protein [Micromonospora sp. WMMD1128]WBB73221.1 hypothetical protein O7602_26635 [Micromonospora sp. WMMD1128]
MQRYERTPAGLAEIPEPCPDGHTGTTPAWGACPVEGCREMGRQWRCREDGCGRVTQHQHEHRGR